MENKYIALESDVGKRLDCFVLEKMPELSRSKIKNLIESGNILYNSKKVKSGEKLKENTEVSVNFSPDVETDLEPQKIDLNIVYEDNDLIIINKQQGLVVHPGNGNKNGTLVNGLIYAHKQLSDVNGDFRPGIVHRLDKNTSGLMVVAKNDMAHKNLANQIATKECKRIYEAILLGNLKEDEGVIDTFIGRDKKDRVKMAVTKLGVGKEAITHFKVIERFKGFCYVQFELKTGRTHQIRVHCKHLGCPILGDTVYGPAKQPFKTNGQVLHSKSISLTQPTTNEKLTFHSVLPDYFTEILNKLRAKN